MASSTTNKLPYTTIISYYVNIFNFNTFINRCLKVDVEKNRKNKYNHIENKREKINGGGKMQDLFDRVEKMKRRASKLEELEKARQKDKEIDIDEEINDEVENKEDSCEVKEVEIKEKININDLVENYDIDDTKIEEILDDNTNGSAVKNKDQMKKLKKQLKEEKKKAKKEAKSKTQLDKKADIDKNIFFFICAFFVYCFIGWIYEVIWEFKVGNGFVNRGFLYGPYLPIYGFGVLTLYFILKKFIKTKLKIGKINIMPIFVFVMILVVASIIEYVASFGMEVLFQKRWWDYSYDFININGRVSLRNSSLLALGALVLLYLVHPILEKIFSKVNRKVLKVLAILIVIIMSIDLVITILGYTPLAGTIKLI